ncbi:MAG: 4Fe-4S binding protein [Thiohalomonadaceae bacterium]
MKTIKTAINNIDLRRFRFWLQLFFFALLMYGGYFAIDLGSRLPTFACAFNGAGRGGICYLFPLQHQLGVPSSRLFSWAGLAVLQGLLIFSLWFFALNKAWCGYACPLGTIQDWITALRNRLGIRYSRYSQGQFRQLSRIKYLLLALMILIPLGVGAALLPHEMGTPFCDICPARMVLPMFTGDFSQLTIDFSSKTTMIMTTLGLLITGLFFTGAFFKKRFFCFFCPMSALHYLLSKPALLKLKKDGNKCTSCGDCYRVCDMEIREIADEVNETNIMQDDCIMCLKCVAHCPEPDALKATFAGIPIFSSTEQGFIKRMHKGQKHEQQ